MSSLVYHYDCWKSIVSRIVSFYALFCLCRRYLVLLVFDISMYFNIACNPYQLLRKHENKENTDDKSRDYSIDECGLKKSRLINQTRKLMWSVRKRSDLKSMVGSQHETLRLHTEQDQICRDSRNQTRIRARK